MKRIILLITGIMLSICFVGCSSKTVLITQQDNGTKIYENKTYNISLKYNKDWKLNTKYIE